MYNIVFLSREEENIAYILTALVFLHSAICPFLYAFNLKDFQVARQKMFKNYDFDLSLSNKLSSRERLNYDSNLSYTYSCSEGNAIEIDECEDIQRLGDTKL